MVKYLRLKSDVYINLISEIEEIDNPDGGITSYNLIRPVQVTSEYVPGNYTKQVLAVFPFIPYSIVAEDKVVIEKSEVLFTLPVKPDMVKLYVEYANRLYAPEDYKYKEEYSNLPKQSDNFTDTTSDEHDFIDDLIKDMGPVGGDDEDNQ